MPNIDEEFIDVEEIEADSIANKENLIPNITNLSNIEIAVDTDDDFIDVETVDIENQSCINKLVIPYSNKASPACILEHTTKSDCFDLIKTVDLQTGQSKLVLKTKDNPIKLKDAKVVIERLSITNILKYTKKPETDKKYTKEEVSKISLKSMSKHYCLKCNKARDVSNMYKKNKCKKCRSYMVIQCLKCNKRCDTPANMDYHLRCQCIPQKPFNCSKCDYAASAAFLLRRHEVRIHSKTKRLKCTKCGRTSKNIEVWRRHVRLCGEEPHMCCKLCSYKTKWSKNLRDHMNSHKNSENKIKIGRYKKIENIASFTSYKLRAHFNRFCPKCNENFENCLNMNSIHCRTCNTKLLLQCLKCDQRFKHYNVMLYHLRSTCVPEARFQCSKCEFSTAMQGNLDRHIERLHKTADPEQFEKCPKCTKSFRMIDDLKKHIKICNTEPQLCCDHCPFKTKYKKSIMNHMKAHMTGSKWVQTYEEKKKSEKEKAKRRRCLSDFCPECNTWRTVVKHNETCPKCKSHLVFRCKRCDAEAPSREALRIHEKEKHPIENKCSKCAKVFSRLNGLKLHAKGCGRKKVPTK